MCSDNMEKFAFRRGSLTFLSFFTEKRNIILRRAKVFVIKKSLTVNVSVSTTRGYIRILLLFLSVYLYMNYIVGAFLRIATRTQIIHDCWLRITFFFYDYQMAGQKINGRDTIERTRLIAIENNDRLYTFFSKTKKK